MKRLSDPATESEESLIRHIHRGYNIGGEWPTWQFVRVQLLRQGIDGASVLRTLPVWQNYYRYTWSAGHMPTLDDSDQIGLSIAGLSQIQAAQRPEISQAFLGAIVVAADRVALIDPEPTSVTAHVIESEQFTAWVNSRAYTSLTEGQLYEVLSHEPATWNAIRQTGSAWEFDLLNAVLWRFLQARDLTAYLDELENMIGIPETITTFGPTDPLALPEALDHLDLAWRLLTSERLLKLPRASLGAKLALDVTSRAEFESALTALADVLDLLQLKGEGKSLQVLKADLSRRLPGTDGIASAAVDTLRHVVSVRVGLQHIATDAKVTPSHRALGLDRFGTDWEAMWNQVRGAAIEALRTIREQIEPLLPI